MKELICGCPAQDQRGRLRRIDTRRHACHALGAECTVGGVRPDDRHIGHVVAKLKAAHAIAELIDFSDDVIAHDERRPAAQRRPPPTRRDRRSFSLEQRGCAAVSSADSFKRTQENRKLSGAPLPRVRAAHRKGDYFQLARCLMAWVAADASSISLPASIAVSLPLRLRMRPSIRTVSTFDACAESTSM